MCSCVTVHMCSCVTYTWQCSSHNNLIEREFLATPMWVWHDFLKRERKKWERTKEKKGKKDVERKEKELERRDVKRKL